jgi:myosin-5
MHSQKKSVETTLSAIQTGKDENLPPLMNPAMLEASDDLTNLSHLNEPAGTHATAPRDAAAAY